MNAFAPEASNTLLYEPLWEGADANRVSVFSDENFDAVAPTTVGLYPNVFANNAGVFISPSDLDSNNIAVYDCGAGTAQPIFFGIDDSRRPFDLLCGSGLIAAKASPRKHWHVTPSWIVEAAELAAPTLFAVMYFKAETQDRTPVGFAIPSTDDQRRDRQATAALVLSIEELLPGLSGSELGALVGVGRVSWRDWRNGHRVARSRKRRQLLRLKRILELRLEASSTEPLELWLDTPIGASLDRTPARLLREGQDQLVATLAARATAPGADDFGLAAPLDLGGLEGPPRDLDDEAVVRAGYDADDSK